MTIADRIQSLRKAKGMSQEELADKVGVSRQAVSKWESEQATPDLDKVLTEKNGKRAKTALKWFLIGFGILLAIDLISMLVYFLVNGFPV